jgi:dihydrolipoamide dehydrogenase
LSHQYSLAIIGGGPGGYVAALRAAQLGARVALIERERVGGTCLNIGCIPTKALTSSTELLVRARRASEFGVTIPAASADLPKMMLYKQDTVDGLVGGVELLLRERKVTLIRGDGHLVWPGLVRVVDKTGVAAEVEAEQVVLAPGSVTARPPIPGLGLPGVLTSTEALDIAEVPERLVIIGGGVIGLEFACIYEALGSQVTVLEMMPSLLPGVTDESLAKRLALTLKRRGIAVQIGAQVREIAPGVTGLHVSFEGPKGCDRVEGDRVLVATGRWPNTDGLGLAELDVRMNGRAIAVNDRLATNLPWLWAIGDAVGGRMLAHKAMVDGRVVAENVTGGRCVVDYRSVPNVIFTRPEVASVGLTEAEARAAGAEVKASQFPFSANPRARILGEPDGLVRLVCEAGSGKVLGVHIMGPHATDLIAEGALAVQMGATADDLAWTTHAHPTLPEAMLEAALDFRGAAIHRQSR